MSKSSSGEKKNETIVEPKAGTTPKKVSVKKVKQGTSMWSDPVVRILGGVVAVIIVGALLTLVVALLNGTIDLSGAPRTMEEYQSKVAEDNWKAGQDDPQAWQDYITSLVNTKQYDEAQKQIDAAKKADLDVSRGDQITYTEGLLAEAQEKNKEAIDLFKKVSETTWNAYEKKAAEGGEKNWAIAYGVHSNYQAAMTKLARLYIIGEDYKDALTVMNTLIEKYPYEAGYYIDRGDIELKLDDKEAAKKDFEQALKFLPDDPDAKAGLEKAKND